MLLHYHPKFLINLKAVFVIHSSSFKKKHSHIQKLHFRLIFKLVITERVTQLLDSLKQ